MALGEPSDLRPVPPSTKNGTHVVVYTNSGEGEEQVLIPRITTPSRLTLQTAAPRSLPSGLEDQKETNVFLTATHNIFGSPSTAEKALQITPSLNLMQRTSTRALGKGSMYRNYTKAMWHYIPSGPTKMGVASSQDLVTEILVWKASRCGRVERRFSISMRSTS
jgi:hypothetical protein